MAQSLHRAIHDALRDQSGYAAKDILVGTFLEATRPLDADDTVLYRAVYTIFRALPARVLPGSTLNISTYDVENGVELEWEWREAMDPRAPTGADLHALLRHGPHGDLVGIALSALEQFCNLRAGYVETTRERVEASTSFDRPPYVVRRVLAHIPAKPSTAGGVREGAVPPTAPEDAQARAPPRPGKRQPMHGDGLGARALA